MYKKLMMSTLFFACAGISAQNLLPGDTSFEAGSDRWFGGKRVESPAGNGVLQLSGSYCHSEIYYDVIEANREYAAAFRARSAKGRTTVRVALAHVRYGTVGKEHAIELDENFRDISFPLPKQPERRDVYFTFRLPAGAVIEADDFRINAGPAALPWQPNAPFALTISPTGAPGNLLYIDETPPELELGAVNHSGAEFKGALNVVVTDFSGATVKEEKFELALAPDASRRILFRPLPAMKAGYYLVSAGLDGDKARRVMPFGVVPRPVEASPAEASFGIHPDPSRLTLAALPRIGVKYQRIMPGWSHVERQKGVYSFPFATVDEAEALGISTYFCVKQIEDVPAYARGTDGRIADTKALTDYLAALAKNAPAGVRAWEIENEPDLCYPSRTNSGYMEAAKYYGETVKLSADALREAGVTTPIAAMPVSGSSNGIQFTAAADKECAASYQILAPHPYTGARYIGPKSSSVAPDAYIREQMKQFALAAGKRSLWAGEFGWAYDRREPFGSETHRIVSNYVARSLILLKSVPEVEKVLYFKAQGCYERDFYHYGLWASEFEPLPSAVFYANVARRLEHSKPLPPVFESDLRIYPFLSRDGKPFAAVWKCKGEIDRIRLSSAMAQTRVTDLFGNPVALTRKEGKLELPVGETPHWVEIDGVTPEEFAKLLGETEIDLPPVTMSFFHFDGASLTGIVRNNLPRKIEVELTAPEVKTQKFQLADGGSKSVTLRFAAAPASELTIKASGAGSVTLSKIDLASHIICPAGTGKGGVLNLTERRHIYPPDPGIGWNSPADLSGSFGFGYDKDFFYFTADVTDPVHYQPAESFRAWNGDSIQLAFDTMNDAQEGVFEFGKDDTEFIAWLGPKGPQLACTYSVSGEFGAPVPGAKVEITREGGMTRYRLAIPWKALGKLTPMPGRLFGMNFIVNQNNGKERSYWLGLTEGIGEMKYPWLYKKFRLE